jgi:hypothetical protein
VNAIISWLLEGPNWLQYRVRVDLLDESPDSEENRRIHTLSLEDPAIQSLLTELANWPGPVLNSHKSAGHSLHKLVFLADLGFTIADPGIDVITQRVLEHVSRQGPTQMQMNISKSYGGSGEDQLAWALCDAPLTLYALIRFGLSDHPAVQKSASFLAGLVGENGWPCAVSPEMGKFRGPGRKEDPCPFANLVMLQALAAAAGFQDHPSTRLGVEALLTAWADRRERHPYMFYMGTDFCKLKAPLVWYDLVHVVEVLTQFPWARNDPRLQEMGSFLQGKADEQGRYTPESIWTAWKDWEFGQKKIPSRWLTFLVLRILSRS